MKLLGPGAAALASAMLVSACATSAEPDRGGQPADELRDVKAELRASSGQLRARSTAEQVGDSIRVRIEADGLAPGAYGAHVHSTGRCDPPDFASAGPHWNPTDQKHGKDNPQGMHKGDLPNLLVGTDGRGSLEYTIPNAWIATGRTNVLLDADGAAIVIHQSPDDYRTDPSGNSGARIACGVFG